MESFAFGCGGACAIRLLNWNTCIVIFWGEKASILIFHIFFTEIYVVRFFFCLVSWVYLKVDKYFVNFCLAI